MARKSKIANAELADLIAKSLEQIESPESPEEATETPNEGEPKSEGLKHIRHYNNEQTSIIRQSSMKSAVSFMSVLLPRLEIESADQVLAHTIAVAEEFERWVTR
jgi:hypothetical protein